MKLLHRCLIASVASLLATSCLGTGNSVNVYGGTRSLSTNDFGSLDDQTVYGADVVVEAGLPFLAVEGGWFHAKEDASSLGGLTDPELATDEYFVGLRAAPWNFLIQPYASAGLTWVDAKLDSTGTSDSDSNLAYYVRVGAAFTIGILRIGLDGRSLIGSDLNLENISSDVDNLQIAGFVGVGF